jgi:hypothetical protein
VGPGGRQTFLGNTRRVVVLVENWGGVHEGIDCILPIPDETWHRLRAHMMTSATSYVRHPSMPELVRGLDLSPGGLELYQKTPGMGLLGQMMANATYWLSFHVERFETWLVACPSPLRELGIAALLRFGERVDGSLDDDALSRMETELIPRLEGEVQDGVQVGIRHLRRILETQAEMPQWIAEGYRESRAARALSVESLRQPATARIVVSRGQTVLEDPLKAQVGEALILEAFDERSRPVRHPEVEHIADAPVLIQDPSEDQRRVRFLVPGTYALRVPGRSLGERKITVA